MHENDKQNSAKHRKMAKRMSKLKTTSSGWEAAVAFRRTKWARRRGLGYAPKGDARKRKQVHPSRAPR